VFRGGYIDKLSATFRRETKDFSSNNTSSSRSIMVPNPILALLVVVVIE